MADLQLRALPNVEFVHGYPGIPANPERPEACIKGSLEVRLGGQPATVKWVRLEFRKLETIPSGKSTEEFVDHIGPGPLTIWEPRHEHDPLKSGDLSFELRIPENIPPSVALEKGCGIKYELCATMSLVKRKKGLFRRDSKTLVTRIVPIVIDKHELHSTWPVYGKHETRRISRPDGLILIVDRGNSCFAPGDPMAIIATVRSENLRPVVLRSLELSLEEEVTFQGGPQGLGKKNAASMNRVNIIGEHKLPLSYTLYGGTQQRVELAVNVPPNHTTTSVETGRHIKISYKIRVRCFLDNSPPLETELPLIMTNWPRHVSAELTRRIGLTPNLTSHLSSQDPLSNGQHVPPPVPAKPVIPNTMSPTNGSITSRNTISTITALNQTGQVLSPTTAATLDNKNQTITSQGSVHDDATSESAIPNNPADEFGYRQVEISTATAPPRLGQRPVSVSDSDDRRSERDGSMSGGSLNRRTRSAVASNGGRFKVVNPDHNIPEEPPLSTRVNSAPYPSRWPTAETEKERLYEDAKARVAHVQLTAFQPPQTNGNSHVTPHTNGTYERTRSVSPTDSRRAWATAENEKQRLYELAQAKVQETQGQLGMAPPVENDLTPPPTSDAQTRRPNSEPQNQPASRSAGAALYSRAIEQISRSSTLTATAPQAPPSLDARRNLTFTAASPRSPVQDKSALLYYQAQQNVRRHLQEQGEVTSPEDGPIPYDQLFGANAVASSSAHGHSPMPASSEKDMLRRHHEQMDARATSGALVSRQSSLRPQTATTTNSTSGPLSEKEIMRRAFEARDAALRAAGQVPPPILPDYNPPAPAFSDAGGTASPLSASEEKARLAEHYRVDNDHNANPYTPPGLSPVPQPQAADPPEFLNVIASAPSRQRSVRSDVSGTETLLRRDPSVSAGKKRQMNIGRDSPSPPPLPPRPPQEYIEETQREDHRTTLRNALPLDFSTSFDLGFDNFGKEGRHTPDVRS